MWWLLYPLWIVLICVLLLGAIIGAGLVWIYFTLRYLGGESYEDWGGEVSPASPMPARVQTCDCLWHIGEGCYICAPGRIGPSLREESDGWRERIKKQDAATVARIANLNQRGRL